MGKGFQNFMSKKDFHPSAWWNLKRVWEARQQEDIKKKREEEMRVQYEKEQDMLNNKALLGDEKAKMGLSFMYDAPTGMNKKDDEEKPEPKFEWQRKYQAPREDWAKGNEQIQDQPFGINVRHVRCVKCHKWGHLNTDNECPLYGKSGNYEDEGYANNPSDLIKELHKERASGQGVNKSNNFDRNAADDERADRAQLAEDMREEHGMKLKGNVLDTMRMDDQLARLGPMSEQEKMKEFLATMSDKKKKKLMKNLMGVANGDVKKKKKSKKEKKKREKKDKKGKSKKRIKHSASSSSSEDSDSDSEEEQKKNKVKREPSSERKMIRSKNKPSPEIREVKREPFLSTPEHSRRRPHTSRDEDRHLRREREERTHRERSKSRSPAVQVKREPESPRSRSPTPKKRRESQVDRSRSRSPYKRHNERRRSPERRRRSPSPVSRRRSKSRSVEKRRRSRSRSNDRRRRERSPKRSERRRSRS